MHEGYSSGTSSAAKCTEELLSVCRRVLRLHCCQA